MYLLSQPSLKVNLTISGKVSLYMCLITDNVTLHLDGVLYYKVEDPYKVRSHLYLVFLVLVCA